MERPALHQAKDAFPARRFGAFRRRLDSWAVDVASEAGLSRSLDRPELHDARNDGDRPVRHGIASIADARTSRAGRATAAVPMTTFIDGVDETGREVP
jgi:hypothetical protein